MKRHLIKVYDLHRSENYNFDNLNVKLLPYSENPNFQSQLNYGIENAQSTYVSFFLSGIRIFLKRYYS